MPRTVPFLIAFKQDLEAFFMFCMIALSQCVKKISLFRSVSGMTRLPSAFLLNTALKP